MLMTLLYSYTCWFLLLVALTIYNGAFNVAICFGFCIYIWQLFKEDSSTILPCPPPPLFTYGKVIKLSPRMITLIDAFKMFGLGLSINIRQLTAKLVVSASAIREGGRERGERGSEGARSEERGSEGARERWERGSEGARERGSEGARQRGSERARGARERESERARERESERARERGSEGARERGSEGARERGSEGARERGSEGARQRGSEVARQRGSEVAWQRGSEVARQRCSEVARQRGRFGTIAEPIQLFSGDV